MNVNKLEEGNRLLVVINQAGRDLEGIRNIVANPCNRVVCINGFNFGLRLSNEQILRVAKYIEQCLTDDYQMLIDKFADL